MSSIAERMAGKAGLFFRGLRVARTGRMVLCSEVKVGACAHNTA
jgi:hypothetical protein